MKKGSLELSIQAVVILVMAMALLGLGLGFIRTLIGHGQDQFTTAIDNAQLENPASATQPITVDRNVEVKASGNAKMRIGFFNKEWTGPTNGWIPTLGTNCTTDFTLTSGAQIVSTGEAKGYEALITLTPGTTANIGNSSVCTVEFKDVNSNIVASKQFYITITS